MRGQKPAQGSSGNTLIDAAQSTSAASIPLRFLTEEVIFILTKTLPQIPKNTSISQSPFVFSRIRLAEEREEDVSHKQRRCPTGYRLTHI